jgi:hypothetical protein
MTHSNTSVEQREREKEKRERKERRKRKTRGKKQATEAKVYAKHVSPAPIILLS